jgi:PadR family transcriptional regulator PadR
MSDDDVRKSPRGAARDDERTSERTGERDDADATASQAASQARAAGPPKNWLVPVVLLMLRQWSSYGYDLMKALTTFGFIMLNPGPLYRVLRQMEKEGLVSSRWDTSGQGPARRLYTITEAGEAYLRLWAHSLEQFHALTDRLLRAYTHPPQDS